MLALLRPSRQPAVVDKKTLVLEAARTVGDLSGLMTSLQDKAPNQLWLRRFDEINKTIDSKINLIEEAISGQKEQGDIHIKRVVLDLRRTQGRYQQYIMEVTTA